MPLLLAFVAALLCTAPIWHGWYVTHEGTLPFVHGRQIAEQWKLFHFVPVWSTTAHGAFGSPQPILYHKTFSYLTAVFDLLGASNSLAVGAALVLTLAAGFLFMVHAVRIVLGERHTVIELTCGTIAISCNYATTNWLVRGDVAELAAQMLLPVLFAWCVLLIRDNRFRWWIGPVVAGLFLSHAAIALYAVLPLAVAVVFALLRWRAPLPWAAPLSRSMAVLAGSTLPFVLPAAPMVRYADVNILHVFTPAVTHVPLWKYVWFQTWLWWPPPNLEPVPALTVQIDPVLLLGAGVTALIVLRGLLRTSRRADLWTPLFLLTVAAACVLLQTRAAAPIFEVVPYLDFIQFPWRLLTFISVALVLALSLVLRAVPNRALLPPLAAAAVLSTVPNKFWPNLHHGRRCPAVVIEKADLRFGDTLEYGPRIAGANWLDTARIVDRITQEPGRCPARWLEDMGHEQAKAHLDVTCASPGSTTLPMFLPPGLRLRIGAHPLPATRAEHDPRATVTLPSGTTRITVLFPTWWSVVFGPA